MTFRLIFHMFILAVFAGCAGVPKIPYSQLEYSKQSNPFKAENIGSDYLISLLDKVQGMQYGDLIFKMNTKVYWIIPEIDKVDLEIIAHEEQFGDDEYNRRLEALESLHNNYLIFSIDLRMPFYSGWAQDQLYDFLKTNLVVTLENGTGTIFLPENVNFNIIEKYYEQARKSTFVNDNRDLEVNVPIRVVFNKKADAGIILSKSIKNISIKLRLKNNPPFKIGFFDDKFYQGFRWKIIQVNK